MPAGRRLVKCLLDSGVSHCFLSSALAAQLSSSLHGRVAGHRPSSVRQTDSSMQPTGGVVAAQLLLGGLDEETTFIKFNVDCEAADADLIFGYDFAWPCLSVRHQ